MSKTILMATVAFGLVAAALAPTTAPSKAAHNHHRAPVFSESEFRRNDFAEAEFRGNAFAESAPGSYVFAESELRRNEALA